MYSRDPSSINDTTRTSIRKSYQSNAFVGIEHDGHAYGRLTKAIPWELLWNHDW